MILSFLWFFMYFYVYQVWLTCETVSVCTKWDVSTYSISCWHSHSCCRTLKLGIHKFQSYSHRLKVCLSLLGKKCDFFVLWVLRYSWYLILEKRHFWENMYKSKTKQPSTSKTIHVLLYLYINITRKFQVSIVYSFF